MTVRDKPKWDNPFTRALVAIHDLYVGEMERAESEPDYVGRGYWIMAGEIQGEGLVVVARGEAAARLKTLMADAWLAIPDTLDGERIAQLRAEVASEKATLG